MLDDLTEGSKFMVGGNADTTGVRDFYAAEVLKTFLAAQAKRRMTPLSRLKWWLGGNGWNAHFDYNIKQSAEKAFEAADIMLEARKTDNSSSQAHERTQQRDLWGRAGIGDDSLYVLSCDRFEMIKAIMQRLHNKNHVLGYKDLELTTEQQQFVIDFANEHFPNK